MSVLRTRIIVLMTARMQLDLIDAHAEMDLSWTLLTKDLVLVRMLNNYFKV